MTPSHSGQEPHHQSLSLLSRTRGIILTLDFDQLPRLSDGGAACPARLRVHGLIPLFCLGSPGVKCDGGLDGDAEAAAGSVEEKPRRLDLSVPEGKVMEGEEERGDGEMKLKGFAHPCIPKDRSIHPAARSLSILRCLSILKLKKKDFRKKEGIKKERSFPVSGS